MDLEEIRRKRRRLFSSEPSDKPAVNENGVIDLTEDTPEPEPTKMIDDEAYARRLQAEFDSEQMAVDSRSRTLSPDGTATTPPRGKRVSIGPSTSARDIESTLRTLYKSIRSHKCQQCATSLFKHEKDVLNLFNYLIEQQPALVGRGIICPDCHMVSRIDNDRLILIWTLLCGFDQSSKHNKPDKKKRSSRTKPSVTVKGKGVGYGGSNRSTHGPFAGAGQEVFDSDDEFDAAETLSALSSGPDPFVAGASAGPLGGMPPGLLGYHYYGPSQTLAGKTVPGPNPAKPKAEAKATKINESPKHKLSDDDKMTAKVLRHLTQLLPSFHKQSEFDMNPPTVQLQCILLGSSILERAAGLFRNNNPGEVTDQAEVYAALVEFTRTLAQHPETSILAFGERVARSPGVSISKVSSGKADLVNAEDSDTTQSLTRCMRELAAQCKTMMKVTNIKDEHMNILRSVADLNDFLTANAGTETTKSADKNSWYKDLAVSEVVDEAMLSKHSLVQTQQQGYQTAQPPPGRMSRIMKEIAILQSSIPDGVFIRYAASRPDVMKILIIGPKDTPYENGLFEFDLLCVPNFPNEPPKMNFRTTGGGLVHFNPNLYADGKVCLSLLGTWQGESWDPKGSTLLQLLVSIQAMIFCENPWNNEPGRENVPNSDEHSKAYNRSLYHHTVQTAMLDWLECRRYTLPTKTHRHGMHALDPFYPGGTIPPPPSPSLFGHSAGQTLAAHAQSLGASRETRGSIDNDEGMWDEVVKKHFDTAKDEILVTVTKWIADKAPPPSRVPQAPGMSAASLHSFISAPPSYLPGLYPPPPVPFGSHQAVSHGPTFAGTGWQGRTLGSGAEDSARKSDTKNEEAVAGPLKGENLAAKLRGAVATLKNNGLGRYGMMGMY